VHRFHVTKTGAASAGQAGSHAVSSGSLAALAAGGAAADATALVVAATSGHFGAIDAGRGAETHAPKSVAASHAPALCRTARTIPGASAVPQPGEPQAIPGCRSSEQRA
jgi:hypothetical protein